MQHHPMLICSVTLALLASLPAAALDEILSGHWLSRDRTTLGPIDIQDSVLA